MKAYRYILQHLKNEQWGWFETAMFWPSRQIIMAEIVWLFYQLTKRRLFTMPCKTGLVVFKVKIVVIYSSMKQDSLDCKNIHCLCSYLCSAWYSWLTGSVIRCSILTHNAPFTIKQLPQNLIIDPLAIIGNHQQESPQGIFHSNCRNRRRMYIKDNVWKPWIEVITSFLLIQQHCIVYY